MAKKKLKNQNENCEVNKESKEQVSNSQNNGDDTQKMLEQLQKENSELKDRLLRALAEVENIRKRAEKEKEDTAKYAIAKFAKEMLGVADNLARALESISEEDRKNIKQLENIYVGVEATQKELMRAFDIGGIKKLEPMDKAFDANFHEVMFEADMPEKPAGQVIEILEDGYTVNGRLLRPARVGVVKKKSK